MLQKKLGWIVFRHRTQILQNSNDSVPELSVIPAGSRPEESEGSEGGAAEKEVSAALSTAQSSKMDHRFQLEKAWSLKCSPF